MLPGRPSRKGRLVLLVPLLCALVLAIVGALPTPSQAGPAQPNAVGPDKITRPEGAKPGVYYIDYGGDPYPASQYPLDGAIRFYGWGLLNPADGVYNWAELDNFIATRKAAGLETGIMITTYDGSDAGDIRSTPDFVIAQANAVLPATYKTSSSDTNDANQPHYINYWKKANYNGNFDYTTHTLNWNYYGDGAIVSNPPTDPEGIAGGWAARVGGATNSTGGVYRYDERVPAMPPGISPAKTVYITARVGIVTTDPNPNDHLIMEIWDSNNNKLGSAQLDINNKSHANNTWKDYEFDASAVATGRPIRIVFRATNDGANPTTFYVDNVGLNVRHLIPNYWPDTDAQRTYYKAYKKFIDVLGARYKNNTDLQFVAIGAGVYGENQPTQSDSYPNFNFDHVVEKYGKLTSADWVDYLNQLALDYATAFSAGDGQGPARHIVTQYAPTYKYLTERVQTTNYAAGVGVGLSLNFLPADWLQSYRNDGTGSYDPIRSYWNDVPIAMESYASDLCNPLMVYWGLIGGVEKHVDYLRTDYGLFSNTANAPYFNWAREYIGKTPANTSKVWTVMREHRNPTLSNCRPGGIYYQKTGASGGTYPELGNYNFYLVQDDAVAGGRTVPETNDKGSDSRYAIDPVVGGTTPNAPDAGLGNCPATNTYRTDMYGTGYPCFKTPYNPDLPALGGQTDNDLYSIRNWTGEGKEAYVVRRTDQATGNPYMFFKIDDGFMRGDGSKTYQATITVHYFDIGTDKFSVKYDSASGEKVAGTVTKTGSKQLKTVTFTVTDAKFLNRLTGGADFYLDSRNGTTNDGNEWVHMVEVGRPDSPIPTDTPTPTPSNTPTPTVTATPATGVVQGTAFHDANGNNKLDAGERGLGGAVLALTDNATGQEAYQAVSGADGGYTFPAVAPGQYTLSEKTPPAGYNKSAYQIMFVVQAGGTIKSGTNFPHTAIAGVTPTPSPTPKARLYLPVLVK